ncbi:unnamed protein product [Fusarium graminearum]|uniref:Uncharacterized protein n=1 Tax=Gibberella zeae TaxID=5518 RepID=A0A4U9EU68_GIBZA|nr:unnamed protein product [Fusarium graminearum]CAG1974818.1 unnamed protein product [Fusarium graminearum]CAG1983034.1 unnamed protein product [Fusarium graminearum]CAG2001051.1 unnamed protein product [Fusarium graminearum]VTO84241.1 unnamed protein product [Fusarium graminearum]
MTKRRNPPPCGPGLCHLPEKISQKTGRVGVGYYYSPSMYFASWKLKPIPGHRTPNIGPAGKDFAEIGGAGVYGPEDFAERYLRGCGSGIPDYGPPWRLLYGGEPVGSREENAVGGLSRPEVGVGSYYQDIWDWPLRQEENAARWSGLFRTRVGYYHLDSLELGPLYREEFAER